MERCSKNFFKNPENFDKVLNEAHLAGPEKFPCQSQKLAPVKKNEHKEVTLHGVHCTADKYVHKRLLHSAGQSATGLNGDGKKGRGYPRVTTPSVYREVPRLPPPQLPVQPWSASVHIIMQWVTTEVSLLAV